MYLARQKRKGQTLYYIRETYPDGASLKSRTLVELGTNPSNHIVYPGGNSFYIREEIVDQLRNYVKESELSELDDIFWRFIKPDIRHALQTFQNRGNPGKSPRRTKTQLAEETAALHLFDKRRVHFLRFGQVDQSRIHIAPPKLFKKLIGKSRDEIEQYLMDSEQILKPREVKTYVYTIFDLQRFFTPAMARNMPECLPREKIDEFFIEQVCRLNEETRFWTGLKTGATLHEYLTRYVIMYFDYDFATRPLWDDYIRNFMNRHRHRRTYPTEKRVSMKDAVSIFEVTEETLKQMDRRGLIRLYRKMVLKYHPDQGGSQEKFVRLTEAYHELLRIKKS